MATTKLYIIVKKTTKTDKEYRSEPGTLGELVERYSYTLQTGADYAHERGRKKINVKPTTIKSLVTNLNDAVNNTASNGFAGVTYTVEDYKAE